MQMTSYFTVNGIMVFWIHIFCEALTRKKARTQRRITFISRDMKESFPLQHRYLQNTSICVSRSYMAKNPATTPGMKTSSTANGGHYDGVSWSSPPPPNDTKQDEIRKWTEPLCERTKTASSFSGTSKPGMRTFLNNFRKVP